MALDDQPPRRFAMWTNHTSRGESERASYSGRSEAVENAEKYWLTAVGLNRVFIRDTENCGVVVFERHYEAQKKWEHRVR